MSRWIVVAILVLVWATSWAAVIYVAVHLIAKYW